MARKDIDTMTITDGQHEFSATYNRLRQRLKNSENAFTFALHEYDNNHLIQAVSFELAAALAVLGLVLAVRMEAP
jgi:hypothetical protein